MNKQRYVILEAHCLKALLDSVTSLQTDGYTVVVDGSTPKICRLGSTQLYVQAMMRICTC